MSASVAHAELGYGAPASTKAPDPLAGRASIVLSASLLATLRSVAKGRDFTRRTDVLFRLDELARGGFIARSDAGAWSITDAGKAYLKLAAERHREWLRAMRKRKAARKEASR